MKTESLKLKELNNFSSVLIKALSIWKKSMESRRRRYVFIYESLCLIKIFWIEKSISLILTSLSFKSKQVIWPVEILDKQALLNLISDIVISLLSELILLSVNINLVSFSIYLNDLTGQIFTLFILTVAAAEAAIGLAIIVVYYRNTSDIDVEKIQSLKG